MLCSFLDGQDRITTFQDLLRVSTAAMIRLKPLVPADKALSKAQKKLVMNEIIRLTLHGSERPKNFRHLEWDIVTKIQGARKHPEFKDLSELYMLLVDQLAAEANIAEGVLFGTKVTRSEDIARVCADRGMKAIIILRDPRATFVSHFRRAQTDPSYRVNTDLGHFIESWREAFKIWRRGGNILNIRYEDFVSDPTLGGRLAAYLERDINPNAVIKTGNSSFGDKSTGKIRPATVDRWREHSDPAHNAQILEGLAREMIEAGYL